MGPNPSSTSTNDFASLGLPGRLVDALRAQGITSAFPIQVATVPDALGGRHVLGQGRTGSGKTLAFVLPMLARLAANRNRPAAGTPHALVLVPTRELATQVQTALSPLASAVGLKSMTVFGGVSQRPQVAALTRGVDVVIACPGRLEDLIRQGHVRLDQVSIAVIDEADHMADLGFLPGVRRILDQTHASGQRLLFSATLDNGVDVLVRRYLTDPIRHSVQDAASEPDIEHHVLTVDPEEKGAAVTELASGKGRSILFTRTKHGARKLALDLTRSGIPAVDLHGNLSQAARDRNLEQFRDGDVRVLVATDVAARGIHVDDVELVVHVDPPAEHKAYTHRSGRTARAGASGVVVTLQTRAQQAGVATMTRKAGVRPTVSQVAPGAKHILNLTGPRAALVTPAALEARPADSARSSVKLGSSGGGQRRRNQPASSKASPAGRAERRPRRGDVADTPRPNRGRAAVSRRSRPDR